MLVSSTWSKSIRVIRLAPSDASCRATCRPMAPTPMTATVSSANFSRGTSPSCRANRSLLEPLTGHLQSLRVEERVVHPVVGKPVIHFQGASRRCKQLALLLARLEAALFGDRCQILLLPVLLLRGGN